MQALVSVTIANPQPLRVLDQESRIYADDRRGRGPAPGFQVWWGGQAIVKTQEVLTHALHGKSDSRQKSECCLLIIAGNTSWSF